MLIRSSNMIKLLFVLLIPSIVLSGEISLSFDDAPKSSTIFQSRVERSKRLVSELKNFIASGGSYAAKIGETDDLVMSTVLALRMAAELKNYLPEIDDYMRDSSDSHVTPMPFVML